MWGVIFGRHLFTRQGEGEQTADENQLAQMAALLGPPPPELLTDSGPRALEFFDGSGSAKGKAPEESLEARLTSALSSEGMDESMTDEESSAFLAFIRRSLTWTAGERASASDLLRDTWITQES